MQHTRILILGGSGFIGNAIYRELLGFYDTYATYRTDNRFFEQNKKFIQYDYELEDPEYLLKNLQPDIIVSAVRGNFESQVRFHQECLPYLLRYNARLIFISSANVFDSFSHYPSYEFDKTLSESVYGRFKIKIENALMRIPARHVAICRVPMVFGQLSPRVRDLEKNLSENEPIEVFPNVVLNATHIERLTQQIHYIINRNRIGIFHLGSTDLIHHNELIKGITDGYPMHRPIFKQVFESNDDRYLAVLPKQNKLPQHLQFEMDEVIAASIPK